MASFRMRVVKYIPTKMYGFCRDASGFEVFFHLAVFQPGPGVELVRSATCPEPPSCSLMAKAPPPPILGEPVDVECAVGTPGGKAPRADRVVRMVTPCMIVGEVEWFDPLRRYGFVMGSDNKSYHLHESEVIDGRLSLAGRHVVFYPGIREGQPRACHVKVCR